MSELIAIRVVPNASKSEVAGWLATGEVKIKLRAPAVDGKANAALIEFVAERVGVAKSAVEIVRGETARSKLLRVAGRAPDAVRAALGGSGDSDRG